MPISIHDFTAALQEAGILTPEELGAARKLHGEDVVGWGTHLLQSGKITAFQAEQLLAGKGAELLLGNYLLQAKLGQGGMGVVFRAEHRRMKRQVALKILPAAAMNTPDAVRRFQREVEAAAKLIHPNIVTAFDADEANGTHYLVMELVEGTDLAQLVTEYGSFPPDLAVQYILQAARGLAYAHEHGIVHRDIKPANLLLDSSGTIKILDLGLASMQAGATAAPGELTKSGDVMGTVDYMAPEQAFETRSVDQRADIYSLGCTLYRLLTGQNLYAGETIVQKLMAHQSQPIPSLLIHCPDLPLESDSLFKRMVAKNPVDRFASMREVIAAFEPLLARTSSTILNFPAEDASTATLRSLSANQSREQATAAMTRTNSTSVGTIQPTTAFSLSNQTTDPVGEASLTAARLPKMQSSPVWGRGIQLGLAASTLAVLLVGSFALWYSRSQEVTPQVNSPAVEHSPIPASNPSLAAQETLPLVEVFTSSAYEWGEPINLGAEINTAGREAKLSLCRDELAIVFTRGTELWISERPTRDTPFPKPQRIENLGQPSGRTEMQGSLSGDALLLAFVTDRAGSEMEDIWLAQRSSRGERFGQAVRLPSPVNSERVERNVVLSADGLLMLVSSDRRGTLGKADVMQFHRSSLSAPFEKEILLPAPLNSSAWDIASWISADKKLVVKSIVDKANSETKLFVRPEVALPFAAGIPLGPPFDKILNGQPIFSADGMRAYFHTRELNGQGDLDLWMIERQLTAKQNESPGF